MSLGGRPQFLVRRNGTPGGRGQATPLQFLFTVNLPRDAPGGSVGRRAQDGHQPGQGGGQAGGGRGKKAPLEEQKQSHAAAEEEDEHKVEGRPAAAHPNSRKGRLTALTAKARPVQTSTARARALSGPSIRAVRKREIPPLRAASSRASRYLPSTVPRRPAGVAAAYRSQCTASS